MLDLNIQHSGQFGQQREKSLRFFLRQWIERFLCYPESRRTKVVKCSPPCFRGAHQKASLVVGVFFCHRQISCTQPINHTLNRGDVHRNPASELVLGNTTQLTKLGERCELGRGQFWKMVEEYRQVTLLHPPQQKSNLLIQQIGCRLCCAFCSAVLGHDSHGFISVSLIPDPTQNANQFELTSSKIARKIRLHTNEFHIRKQF